MKNNINFFSAIFFIIVLINASGCSTSTDDNGNSTTTVVPVPPSNLTGVVFSTSQINLSWTDNSTNETGFKVDRKTGTGNYAVVGSVGADITAFNDVGLTPNTAYTYRVYAFNVAGNSPTYSNEITITTTTQQTVPTLTSTTATNIISTGATSGGNIVSDGGAAISTRGVVWSTSQNPTIALTTKTTDGSGIGTFTSNLLGLNPNTQYYVRSYATNSLGTAYGNEISFTTTNVNYASMYPTGTVFCNNVVTAVVDVTNPTTGKTWMDRNLGASQVATSTIDALAYGDLYQWGRRADGHQCRNSATTTTLSSTNQPANGNFIIVNSENNDWRNPQNNNLWQGVNGVNNPCPSGYRLPTETELNAERTSWSSNNSTGAFASPLKLSMAGVRIFHSGSLTDVGDLGDYWSSTVSDTYYSKALSLYSLDAPIGSTSRAYGLSVRCIKN
jgi:uncharacterized protein (TIGR02145 family)